MFRAIARTLDTCLGKFSEPLDTILVQWSELKVNCQNLKYLFSPIVRALEPF